MSDAYSDFCKTRDEKHLKWQEEQRKANEAKMQNAWKECKASRPKANFRYVKCCATCEFRLSNKDFCKKLGYSVDDLCICDFYLPEQMWMLKDGAALSLDEYAEEVLF